MLDVSLENIVFDRGPDRFGLEIDARFAAGTHTALAGPAGSGKSTIVRLLHGSLRPAAGIVRIGTRDATRIAAGRRPILHLSAEASFPERWSVQHVLLAALQGRSLDREDRFSELRHLAGEWGLDPFVLLPYRELDATTRLRARLARLEALRPAILVAERPLSGVSPSERPLLMDRFYRMLRVIGATLIVEIDSFDELGSCDRLVVVDRGRVVQEGSPGEVFAAPRSRAAAEATGIATFVPVEVRDGRASSFMGEWEVAAKLPFSGPATAVVRPDVFSIASSGEESDLILGIEEAHFRDGRWEVVGLLTGGTPLRVRLPAETPVHKGRLIPLRFDPSRIPLLAGGEPMRERIPTDVIPPLRGPG